MSRLKVNHSIRTPIETNTTGTPYSTKFVEIDGMTLQRMFRLNCERFSERNCLGFRPIIPGTQKKGEYNYISYKRCGEIVTYFGSGLRKLGLELESKVGIMAKNCVEWEIADYGIGCLGLISVPVYDSYGPSECEYIICHSDMKAIICSADKVSFLSGIIKSKVSSYLKYIIIIDDPANPNAPLPEGATHRFSEIVAMGKENPLEDVVAQVNTVLTIVYTSGTTGSPKGAMITHNNVCAAANQLITRAIDIEGEPHVFISYLPLAHIFERIMEFAVLTLGGSIGYFSGSMVTLTDDMTACKPSLLVGVPRVFSKTYSKIQANILSQPFYKRWIFAAAYKSKLSNLQKGKKTPWADRLVFSQIQKVMGGRLRLIYNGSASLPYHISEFLSTVFGVMIGEGYGLTETSATVTCSEIIAFDPGNAGRPYIKSEVCLESIPEMDYYITDKPYPRGEILNRGPQVFIGYYKDEEGTNKALDEEGWFHTGDVGSFVPGPYKGDDGKPAPSLKIIDRKKNIFKLSQGEFICAERVESIIIQSCPYIKQMMVYGPSTSSSLIGIVVPEWDVLLEKGRNDETHAEEWGKGAVKRYWEGVVNPEKLPDEFEKKEKVTGKKQKKESEKGSSSSASAFSSSSSDAQQDPASSVPKLTSPSSSSSSSSSSSTTEPPPTVLTEITTPLPLRLHLQSDPSLKVFLLSVIRKACEANADTIRRFEIPRGVVVCGEEWTDQNKCLTASMKMKRDFIRNKYKEEFQMELARVESQVDSKDKAEGKEAEKKEREKKKK